MIDINKIPQKVYVAFLEITKTNKPIMFGMRIIDDEEQINTFLRNYYHNMDIYWIDHWFDNETDCKKYVIKLNTGFKHQGYTMIDYFCYRFNVTKRFATNNKQVFQKLLSFIKCGK